VDDRGTTTYGYDSRDRLTSLTYPDGRRLEYGWDGHGNRTSLTARVGSTALVTGYTYDALNRLRTVTDPLGRTYTHGYDENGNRASMAYPNGTSTTYTYDTLNRLRTLSTASALGTVQSYSLTLGATGNRTRIDEADGTSRQYTYDDLYRLTGETVSGGPLPYGKTFAYDDVGNRLTQTHNGVPTAYTYDTRDRLLTEAGQSHTYDDDGNLLAKSGEAAYTWDLEKRLVRAVRADGTVVEHTYDPDGNRVQSRTTPPGQAAVVVDLLVDTSGPVSQVVTETDAATGAIRAHYVRGDDLLSVMRGGGTRFYHADAIGSVRRLTDETGAVTDTYTYSAFGELLGHTGTDPQPYAFAGEPYDPNTGFQYHRARWMDPRAGRFLGMDPFDGLAHEPLSLHRYLYAHVSPLDHTDPSGEMALAGQVNMMSAMNTLMAMTVLTMAIQQIALNNLAEATTGAAGELFDEASYAAQRMALIAEQAITATYRSTQDLLEKGRELVRRIRLPKPKMPKIVVMPRRVIPNVAENIAPGGGVVGMPPVLTRTTTAAARINRRRALQGRGPAGLGYSWDEYPFASSIQGGWGARVERVPALENLVQGGLLGAAYLLESINVGDSYLVVVVP
jgi:RHS repeat-associated protein